MSSSQVVLDDGRVLTIAELPTVTGRPFALLLAAYEQSDLDLADRYVSDLLAAGCVEICCVGPKAETQHDALDCVIEDADQLHIVTTWHDDVDEGCEYFVHVAGGKAPHLLALLHGHAEIKRTISDVVESSVKPRSAPPS